MTPSEHKTELMIYQSQLDREISSLDAILAQYSINKPILDNSLDDGFFKYRELLEETKRTATDMRNAITAKLTQME